MLSQTGRLDIIFHANGIPFHKYIFLIGLHNYSDRTGFLEFLAYNFHFDTRILEYKHNVHLSFYKSSDCIKHNSISYPYLHAFFVIYLLFI